MQGMEETTVKAGPTVSQQGRPVDLYSYQWKGMKEKFLKGQPKVLGAMQIMTGLMIFSIGIITLCGTLSFRGPKPLSVYIGYSFWGSVMEDVLQQSAAMDTKQNDLKIEILVSSSKQPRGRSPAGLVQASLSLNITSSVLAGVGMITTMVSFRIFAHIPFICYHQSHENCPLTTTILIALEGVVLLLSTLELCVALSVSSFGCQAVCCYVGGVVLVLPSYPPTTETASSASLERDSMPPKYPG
nr:membrane-spanning 4-domains subfamily A member 4A [Cavia porcellus]